MRALFGAILLSSPIALLALSATPASADQMIQELRSTATQPAAAAADSDPSTAAPTVEHRAAATQAVRRHRVAGSHYDRERLKQSSIHG